MRGELDFEESLRSRVALLAGLDASALDKVYDALQLAPGARTLVRTLHRLGYRFAIVSGGFSRLTDRLAHDLAIDYARANELEIVDGQLTGRIVGAVVDRKAKADATPVRRGLQDHPGPDRGDRRRRQRPQHALRRWAGHRFQREAGRPGARAHTAVNVPYLDTILYLLGISRDDIEAADARDGITTPAPPVDLTHATSTDRAGQPRAVRDRQLAGQSSWSAWQVELHHGHSGRGQVCRPGLRGIRLNGVHELGHRRVVPHDHHR